MHLFEMDIEERDTLAFERAIFGFLADCERRRTNADVTVQRIPLAGRNHFTLSFGRLTGLKLFSKAWSAIAQDSAG